MVYWRIEAGARAATHRHPHEQFVWMVKGSMDFRIRDEKRTVSRHALRRGQQAGFRTVGSVHSPEGRHQRLCCSVFSTFGARGKAVQEAIDETMIKPVFPSFFAGKEQRDRTY